MNILAICQYYHPEPMRFTDMCEELVRRGHRVTVLTGVPNYPAGEIYPDYRHRQQRRENINGVEIIRCGTHPRKSGTLHRVLNYFSYPLTACWQVGRLREAFDVVLVNQQSPVMMGWPAIRYKKKHGKKIVLYCMDLWPASLTAGGIREGSLLFRLFHRLSAAVYRQADRILITSGLFANYLTKEFGIATQQIRHLPQYAEELFTATDPAPHDTVNLMFAGNVGAAQSLDTILEAAERLKDIPALHWHIVGDGSERQRLEKSAADKGLSNVLFHGRKPLEEMPAYYAMADAMLVTLCKDPVISLTLPGKVQTYMAAEKPIIAAADGETAAVIAAAGCGYCVPAEDNAALANAVRRFLEHIDSPWGQNGKAYYDRHFRRSEFFNRLEATLYEISVH
ncbi:MAG: glycosyltransferase family 4 protein [Clostridia bacterium]|nr:glycosyltransferase family 4 protein [Clostridia bacterium]